MGKLDFFTDGEAYERMMGRWSRAVGGIFLDWLDVPKGLRWLDVGCGNGAFTDLLVTRCAPRDVHGIDPSEAQIAFARLRETTKSATFQVGDAQDLPFGAATFDAAAMALVISFLPEPAKAVAEMARVVRPGGWVATYMWEPGTGQPGWPFNRAARELGLTAPSIMPSLAAARRPGMQALWQERGPEAVEARQIEILARVVS